MLLSVFEEKFTGRMTESVKNKRWRKTVIIIDIYRITKKSNDFRRYKNLLSIYKSIIVLPGC